MNICIFGFGATPSFIYYLLDYEKVQKNNKISVVLQTSHHEKMMREKNIEKLFIIHKEIAKYKLDEDLFNWYIPKHIFEALETEKRAFKGRDSLKQTKIALLIYREIKKFLEQIKPRVVLFVQTPEGGEGVIFYLACKELKIPCVFPHHTRYFGKTFFSDFYKESRPKKISLDEYSKYEGEAKNLLRQFNAGEISADNKSQTIKSYKDNLAYKKPNKFYRLMRALNRLLKERYNRDYHLILVSIKNAFPLLRDSIRLVNKKIDSRLFHIRSLEDLSFDFIYYPLQYSPEASINIPAPYFIDQERAIDAIRLSLPANTFLVVKEHPACIGIRNANFVKKLMKKPGVVVVYVNLSSKEIIKKSKAVISITGSAALEAYMMQTPALLLGPAFFDDYLGGVCSIDDLSIKLSDVEKLKRHEHEIIRSIAEVLSCSYNFLALAPDGLHPEVMTRANIASFWESFVDYCNKAGITES
jgi:hypothetical protein